jgi:protein-S-isoprenylcysteine O-methyltransferase Ste14
LAGHAVNYLGAGLFHRLRTAIIPFKPASRLVTSGIYRWTRNPMYLGMALIYAGVAILFDSPVALLLLVAVVVIIQRSVIAREEAYLERAFGDEYRVYKGRVRRWM